MSTASMVEIAETNEVAPLARWGERRRRARAADFDLAIGALSRRLSDPDTDGLASVIAPTLEALGEGLSAVRADYYTVDPTGEGITPEETIRPIGSWLPIGTPVDEPAPTSTFDPATRPALFAALEAGEAHRVARRTEVGRGGGWSSVRSELFVPCPSPSGLRGFVRI